MYHTTYTCLHFERSLDCRRLMRVWRLMEQRERERGINMFIFMYIQSRTPTSLPSHPFIHGSKGPPFRLAPATPTHLPQIFSWRAGSAITSDEREEVWNPNQPICFKDYRFFTSVAQPSIPSPLVPTGIGSLTSSMPLVPSTNGELLIPPAFALFSGNNSSIGSRKSAIRFDSSTVKWYFSRRTSGRAQ